MISQLLLFHIYIDVTLAVSFSINRTEPSSCRAPSLLLACRKFDRAGVGTGTGGGTISADASPLIMLYRDPPCFCNFRRRRGWLRGCYLGGSDNRIGRGQL